MSGIHPCAGCGAHQGPAGGPALIGRREFLAAGALAAAAALLAACSDGGGSPTAPGGSGSSSFTVKVSDYAALASVGGVAVVSAPNGYPLAVVRTSGGYTVLSRVCPHQGATVNATSGGFTCPRHGARFDATGRWVGGERTSSLSTVASSYDAATGTLTIG